ncbi:Gamma-aminobutyric acid type B receptor subunit 1 [Holothuria leucospilota]|uniref:Gamma-aminobutyric acid type B receptor subunit 2 n=1 Tax=Holothuria leucospilota TaxID=206669 RepID=A0A9Q1CHX4_HOLLE|nr:Gamma-aminobutyric acid type B receptor subunit 1 [Holothuria leucospilota]
MVPYPQSTNVPLVSFVSPYSIIPTSGSPYDKNRGSWFTDGYHWTTERPNSTSFDEKPLFLSALFSLDGDDWDGSGLFVAADLALKLVNNKSDILPGYRLFMSLANTKCNDGVAIQTFFEHLFQAPTKLAVIGPACSLSAKPIASTAHFWNLNIISPTASSPSLSNRKKYQNFFRVIPSETLLNQPRINLIRLYKWTRVATIHHSEEMFALSIDDLLTRLKDNNITVISSESFDEDPTNQVENLRKQDAKIIITSMFEKISRKVFCEAFKLGMYGEGYVWFIPGWYVRDWYKEDDKDIDCTVAEMTYVVESSKYIGIQEKVLGERDIVTVAGIVGNHTKKKVSRSQTDTDLPTSPPGDSGSSHADTSRHVHLSIEGLGLGACDSDPNASDSVSDSEGGDSNTALTPGEYETQLNEHFEQDKFAGYSLVPESTYGYDAIWAAALALDKTAEDIRTEDFENDRHRALENFSYSDDEMGGLLSKAIESVNFTGVSGPVSFIQGDRTGVVDIKQLQVRCGEGWTIYSSYCYLFVASKKSWDKATNHCRDEGAHLVSILSEDENEALTERGQEQIPKGTSQWWLSLKESQEGDLKWSVGQKRELQWSPWEQDNLEEDDGDSNHGEDRRLGDISTVYMETCYILDLALKTWLRVNCTNTLYSFICKKRAEYKEVVIATYNVKKDEVDWIRNIVWPGGVVPLDHTPVVLSRKEEIYEGISFVIYITTCSAATGGILFAIVCFIFNLKYSQQRFIKMSSPNLNSLIIIGCILIYVSTCMAGWESLSVNRTIFLKFYQQGKQPALIELMTPPLLKKPQCFVLHFLKGRIESSTIVTRVKSSPNTDSNRVYSFALPQPSDSSRVESFDPTDSSRVESSNIVTPVRLESSQYVTRAITTMKEDMANMVILQPYIQYCTSDHQQYWLGTLYSYKALLLIFGVFLAWETRKVSIPALNDSKLIGLCVYNVVLLSAIGVGVSLVLTTDPSVSFMFTSVIQIFGTSMILIIIFIPKIVSVIQYPEGKPITTMKSRTPTSRQCFKDSEELRREVEKLKAQLNEVTCSMILLATVVETMQGQCPRCQHSGGGIWCINAVYGCFDEIHPQMDRATIWSLTVHQ